MNRCLRSLFCLLAVTAFALLATNATARPNPKQQHTKKASDKTPEKKAHEKKPHAAKETRSRNAAAEKRRHAKQSDAKKKSKQAKASPAPKEAAPPLTGDLALVKEAIELARKAKTVEATATRDKITDPAAQKLVEWYILRHTETTANFARYAAFIAANPEWPSMALLRRRAEARLWQERSDAAKVRGFIGEAPAGAKGKLALARIKLTEGDRDGAGRLARDAWRSDELSERLETEVRETFGDLLTRDDHRARMGKRIGAKDLDGARRAAKLLGGDDDLAIVKACAAVRGKADKAKDTLDAVAAEARGDLGYTLCRIQWMLAEKRIDDAARLMLAAAPETMALQDTDQWWRERRMLARKLLDEGKFQTAYDVIRPAATPANDYYRADHHFMCGWIALRYLDDPATAARHFRHIDDGQANPIVLARANYWRGRAAEALGQHQAMLAAYEAAARYPTAYYGQLARARLGRDQIELRPPSPVLAADGAATDERVRAAEMLYEIGERDVVLYFAADLGEQSSDVTMLEALGELTGRRNDARAMLQVGKPSLGRGLALDHYAFPTIGIPPHKQIAPEIEHSMIYAVARTESAFDQRDKSHADAVGLMQITPEAGRDTAKRFGVQYDWDRMVSDPVYNTQMGAGELSALLSEYKGSHIMTFAGYNAGRGRVRDWIKLYGDPRDPKVDAVDWVERIPFSETRNYVQRVIENLAVYRVRFDSNTAVAAKTEQRVFTKETNAAPLPESAAR